MTTGPTTRDQAIQLSRGPQALARTRHVPPAPSGITGKMVLQALRKRKWLIIISVAFFTAVAVIATAIWLKYWPFYTATALLSVRPPENVLVGRTTITRAEELDRRKATFVALAKRQSILTKAAKSKEVKGTTWYQERPQDVISRMFDEIQVSAIMDTELLKISMTGRRPKELPEIINVVAKAFVDASRDVARQDQFKKINQLTTKALEVQNELLVIDRAVKTLRRPDAPDLRRSLFVLGEQLGTLAAQWEELALAHQQIAQQLAAFQQQERDGLLDSMIEVLQALSQDPSLQVQIRQEVATAATAEAYRQKYGLGHPIYQRLRIQLASLRSQIAERRTIVQQSTLSYLKDALTRQLDQIQAQMASVQRRSAEARERSREVQESLAAVEAKASRRKFLEESLNTIESRRMELTVTRRIADPVRIVQPAVIPEEPSMPKWEYMIPVGVFFGLAIGVGLALLLEFIDTSIRSPSDVATRVDLPVLGIVPHTNDLDEDIEDLRLAFMTHPNSLVGEAFRQVRTCLQFAGPAAQTRSLLITSALPGDGRGTVTMNLGAAMAHGGRKVLIVDANFRQPMIGKLFPQCPDSGLSNALVGQTDWEQLVYEVEPNLSVMASGPLPPNPAELLGSDHMRNLLEEMSAKYDQILFDGAPCLLVTDSPILSTLVDGVVLVVRAGVNTHGVVRRARDTLKRVGGRVLGVVLNGIRVTAGGYLRESYRTFYEYHEQEQLPGE